MTGKFITEKFNFDGGRLVTVYVPQLQPEIIVFAGDGQEISQWGSDLEATGLPPVMIVGIHRCEDETKRLHEYTPVFDAERFAAHEKFLLEEVRPWALSRFNASLPVQRTAFCGISASGELSLAMGFRHPDIFGIVFSCSPGAGYRPPEVLPTLRPAVYLVAGDKESFFLENAQRWADALNDVSGDVVMAEREGGHGDKFWREEFPVMLAWVLKRQ